MYDHPILEELLAAVANHLEKNLIPVVKGDQKLYFQSLIALNLIRVAGRELTHAGEHQLAELERLNTLQGKDEDLPHNRERAYQVLARRNQELCEEIQAGLFDDLERRQELFIHLLKTTQEQLRVSNPKYLAQLEEE